MFHLYYLTKLNAYLSAQLWVSPFLVFILRLVAVRETTHAAHHAEHVVVERIHAHLGRAGTNHRVDGHRQLERRLVDAREVARARRLVLLRA